MNDRDQPAALKRLQDGIRAKLLTGRNDGDHLLTFETYLKQQKDGNFLLHRNQLENPTHGFACEKRPMPKKSGKQNLNRKDVYMP